MIPNMKKTNNKIVKKGKPVEKLKIGVTKEIKEKKEEVKKELFREGDILIDKSSGKRFHFHNQSVVLAEPNRFSKE